MWHIPVCPLGPPDGGLVRGLVRTRTASRYLGLGPRWPQLSSLLAQLVVLCILSALSANVVVRPAWAEPIDGAYAIDLTGSDSIWPLEDFNDCESDVIRGVNVDVCLGMSFIRSGRGAIQGSGTFDFSASGLGVEMSGILAGTLRGSIHGKDRRGYRQTVRLSYQGSVSVPGVGGGLPARMTGRLRTTITPAGLVQTQGTLTVQVKRGGNTRARIQTDRTQLPDGAGDWTLHLILAASADQKKLSGTAEVALASGSRFVPISGSYFAKQDSATLRARGRGTNKGVRLVLKGLRSSGPGLLDAGMLTYTVEGFNGRKRLN